MTSEEFGRCLLTQKRGRNPECGGIVWLDRWEATETTPEEEQLRCAKCGARWHPASKAAAREVRATRRAPSPEEQVALDRQFGPLQRFVEGMAARRAAGGGGGGG